MPAIQRMHMCTAPTPIGYRLRCLTLGLHFGVQGLYQSRWYCMQGPVGWGNWILGVGILGTGSKVQKLHGQAVASPRLPCITLSLLRTPGLAVQLECCGWTMHMLTCSMLSLLCISRTACRVALLHVGYPALAHAGSLAGMLPQTGFWRPLT